MPFDFNFINLEIVFNNCFNNLFYNNSYFNKFYVKILYFKQPSIRDIFVHNSLVNNNKKFYFSKCKDFNCKVCFLSSSKHFVNLNGFLLPILTFSNCNVKECICIIKCKLCKDTYYIGETSNFRKRILKHCSDIRTFVAFYKYTCVSIHFNHTFHLNFQNLSVLFEFYFFDSYNLDTKSKRLNKENQIINLFLELNMNVINDDLPNKYSISLLA